MHSYFPGWKIPDGNSDFMPSNLVWILVSGFRGGNETDWGKMVNAITERNQNSLVLHSVHHLPKPWRDRLTRVSSRKALFPKACDTASSHRYLLLGTFCQRAVRGGCIADYASCILSILRGLVKAFRYSFSEAIPIFFSRLKSGFLLVRSL